MARIPFALEKLIPPGPSDPRIDARIGILHVDAGNAFSLYEFFRDRSGGIESHGHVRKDGVLEQYRDTSFQADANLDANDFALSFETQGFGEGEWTAEQLATIKRVIMWARDEHGIPLRVVTSWNDPQGGWGYHTLFGSPSHWTPVAKSCPGPDRIRQFNTIIRPWLEAGGEEDDMADQATKEQLNTIEATAKKVLQEVRASRAGRRESDKKVKALLKSISDGDRDDATKAQAREILALLESQEDAQ